MSQLTGRRQEETKKNRAELGQGLLMRISREKERASVMQESTFAQAQVRDNTRLALVFKRMIETL